MNVYIFQADIYCEACGKALCESTPKPAGMLPDNESTWDSDDYPKGPYGNGGGEADSPQHCGSCGLFLENPLTGDGDSYVREQAAEFEVDGDQAWCEVADAARNAGKHHLAAWIDCYFSPGL